MHVFGGIKNEMLFSGMDDEGEPFENWYHVVVVNFVNEKDRG